MPLVRIDIMEGRPPEKIRELHSRVAALVAEIRAYYASPQAAGLDRQELAGYPYAERGYAASE